MNALDMRDMPDDFAPLFSINWPRITWEDEARGLMLSCDLSDDEEKNKCRLLHMKTTIWQTLELLRLGYVKGG